MAFNNPATICIQDCKSQNRGQSEAELSLSPQCLSHKCIPCIRGKALRGERRNPTGKAPSLPPSVPTVFAGVSESGFVNTCFSKWSFSLMSYEVKGSGETVSKYWGLQECHRELCTSSCLPCEWLEREALSEVATRHGSLAKSSEGEEVSQPPRICVLDVNLQWTPNNSDRYHSFLNHA